MPWTLDRLNAALPEMSPPLMPPVMIRLAKELDDEDHLLDACAERGYQYPQMALVVTSLWVINLNLRTLGHGPDAVVVHRVLWSSANSATFTSGQGGSEFSPHFVQVAAEPEYKSFGVPFHGNVDPDPLLRVFGRIREQIHDVRTRGMNQILSERAREQQGDDDLLARLERLAALRQSGALSDSEFAAAKRRILG